MTVGSIWCVECWPGTSARGVYSPEYRRSYYKAVLFIRLLCEVRRGPGSVTTAERRRLFLQRMAWCHPPLRSREPPCSCWYVWCCWARAQDGASISRQTHATFWREAPFPAQHGSGQHVTPFPLPVGPAPLVEWLLPLTSVLMAVTYPPSTIPTPDLRQRLQWERA